MSSKIPIELVRVSVHFTMCTSLNHKENPVLSSNTENVYGTDCIQTANVIHIY